MLVVVRQPNLTNFMRRDESYHRACQPIRRCGTAQLAATVADIVNDDGAPGVMDVAHTHYYGLRRGLS